MHSVLSAEVIVTLRAVTFGSSSVCVCVLTRVAQITLHGQTYNRPQGTRLSPCADVAPHNYAPGISNGHARDKFLPENAPPDEMPDIPLQKIPPGKIYPEISSRHFTARTISPRCQLSVTDHGAVCLLKYYLSRL